MKRILFFLMFIGLFISCSKKNNDNNKPSGKISINPPGWIQGNWYEESGYDLGSKTGFRFTRDDFCAILNNSYHCFKEPLEMAASIPNTPYTTKVNEISTGNEYQISITARGTTTSYDFEKVSDNKIEMNGAIYERH